MLKSHTMIIDMICLFLHLYLLNSIHILKLINLVHADLELSYFPGERSFIAGKCRLISSNASCPVVCCV